MQVFESIIAYIPAVWFWIFLGLAFLKLFRPSVPYRPRTLAVASGIFVFLYAALLTIGQYFLWKSDPFTQTFLNSPLKDLPLPLITLFPWLFKTSVGYLVYYSWSHFWLPAILNVFVAFVFNRFLVVLERFQARFFVEGETTLGFLIVLLVGWPNFVVFIPVAFIAVLLISIVRGIFLHEPYTTLGMPFVFAGVFCGLFAESILRTFGLLLNV